MQITRPTGRPRTPTTQTTKRPRWVVGGTTILTFVALLYLVELIDQLSGSRLDVNGIRPLKTDGLWGVIFAPLLHANWHHLMANTIPLLVLGFLMTLAGLSRFVWATAIIWILGGLGTWLIGNVGSSCGPTDHIGASGLTLAGWPSYWCSGFLCARDGISSLGWWSCLSMAASCSARCRCWASVVACHGRVI